MKDLVLQGMVNGFADDLGISELEDSDIFELFATSSVLRKYHHQSNVADIEDDVVVGGHRDGGIDAVAILVDGHPVQSIEDVDSFIAKLGRLDVEFVFVQAKTSAKFNSAAIGTFLSGVEEFFTAESYIPLSEELLNLSELSRSIFQRSVHMQTNPRCCLYFVTSGEWTQPTEVMGRVEQGIDHIRRLNLFSDVKFTPIDAELLKVIYRELEHGVTKSVEISKTTTFPRIDGVNEAYIGLMAGDQFIDLVSTSEGDLNRNLFYDNVRDFQGHNSVNREINQTLSDSQLRNCFPLLNNGVTIVARRLNRTGDLFTLSDFQIVNGCQTTHLLFENRHSIDAKVFIPVKVVATGDRQVVTDVIKATNRQTQVLPEALESLSPFHRELEDFYSVQERDSNRKDPIYYERRSKQYSMDGIRPSNIVTLTAQVKSFVAMFMNEPHSHPRYYGELLKAYHSRLFVEGHKPAPYYASGITLLLVEKLFNTSQYDRRLKRYKHHMLMLIRMKVGGVSVPNLRRDAITKYSLDIVDTLRDHSRMIQEFNWAVNHVNRTLTSFNRTRSEVRDRRNTPDRLRAFTQMLIDDITDISDTITVPYSSEIDSQPSLATPQLGEYESGTIRTWDDWKNFGFIDRDVGGSIFVHTGELVAVPWRLWTPGTRVSYKIVPGTEGRVMAGNVTLENTSPVHA